MFKKVALLKHEGKIISVLEIVDVDERQLENLKEEAKNNREYLESEKTNDIARHGEIHNGIVNDIVAIRNEIETVKDKINYLEGEIDDENSKD